MQKNLPKYTPDWVPHATVWAEASHREVTYALCDDRRTLLWFANQRAVEYHPALIRAGEQHADAPRARPRPARGRRLRAVVARGRMLIRRVLDDVGLAGAVKTSGAKGVHVFVPIDAPSPVEDVGRRHPGDRRPRRGARPGDRDHGVHPRDRARQGLPRLHPLDRRHRRRGLQPADPARRAGVVPGRVGRPRRTSRRPTSPSRRRPACSATATRGRRRCRPRRSCRPSWSSTATRSPSPGWPPMHEGKRRKRAQQE